MKISIYTSLYLVNENKFDFWKKSLLNFSQFADEVIIGTCHDGLRDGTMDVINQWAEENNVTNVFLHSTKNINFGQISFDGALKNLALQETQNPVKIQMDADEIFPLSQKGLWLEFIDSFMASSYEAAFIPTLDLWGDEKVIRSDKNIGIKARIHKKGLYRGVNPAAWLPNGKFKTELSDSTELLTKNGEFPFSLRYPYDWAFYRPENVGQLKDYPYTLHYGFVNLAKKADLGKVWWKQKWEERSGKEENVAVEENELLGFPTIEHNLTIS